MAAPGLGSAGGFSSPAPRERLEAGRLYEIRWEGLPPGIEEMELLVSCDGGRNFVRVADDLEPSTASYSWVVSSLPSEEAVLAIRGRIDGRETMLLRTGPFAIDRRDGRGLEALSYHGGELWTDVAGTPTPLPESGLASPASRTLVALPAPDEPDQSLSDADSTAPGLSGKLPGAPRLATRPSPAPARPRSPLDVPLQN